MGTNHTTGLPGLLSDIAALLGGLPLDVLPDLHNLEFTYELMAGTWVVYAQLFTVGDDAERSAAVRAWATALDAEVRLDGPQPRIGGGTYQGLEVVRTLDYGTDLHIWTHIAETRDPAPAGL